jgi:hypothetical protein
MVILYITKGFKGNQKAMMREMETIKRVKWNSITEKI